MRAGKLKVSYLLRVVHLVGVHGGLGKVVWAMPRQYIALVVEAASLGIVSSRESRVGVVWALPMWRE